MNGSLAPPAARRFSLPARSVNPGCTATTMSHARCSDRLDALPEHREQARPRCVTREPEAVVRHGVEAVRIDDVQASARFAGLPAPRRAAGCMAGREVRRDRQRTDAQDLTVGNHSHRCDRSKSVRFTKRDLRIVGRRKARFERPRARRTRGDDGATGALECRDTADVVVVCMRRHNQPDVFGAEPELADIRVDERNGLRQRGIEQNQTLVRRDQHCRQARNAHVEGVAERA